MFSDCISPCSRGGGLRLSCYYTLGPARAVSRHTGSPGRLIFWPPLKQYSSTFFGYERGWWIILRTRAQIADKFPRNSFLRSSLCLLPTYFRLFQWRLCTRYRLASVAASRLAHPTCTIPGPIRTSSQLLFCIMTNKRTIISQTITLLPVSTLSCHPQGACNQYLAKSHKCFNF